VGNLAQYQLCEHHFREWLHSGLSGCRFASMLAAKQPVRIDFYSPLGALDHQLVEAFIDGTAARELTAVLLFPALRTPRQACELLATLRRGGRWRVSRIPWPDGYRKADSVALGLEWKTKAGPISDAMGLAPFGTMPVTRRAPYVATAVWGGPHVNEHIRKGARVGVASASTGLNARQHQKLMAATDGRVRDLLEVPPAENPEWLRQVAFVLPKAPALKLLEAKR
jgi:hypothetical protein